MIFIPDILKFSDGTPVTAENIKERRLEMLDILRHEEYGYAPKAPEKVIGKIISTEKKVAAGHAHLERIEILFDMEYGEFTFPINLFLPNTDKKVPVFVLINFFPEVYNQYCPLEEIIDNGYGLAVLYYNDITSDNGSRDGILSKCGWMRDGTAWGCISAWAYGASRVVDYLFTREEIDTDNIAVIGHSRLGKTALWCGAQDERVKLVCSNDSGCAGAAYERAKHEGAETAAIISNTFPYWFCGNYMQYFNDFTKAPFDQHFLLGCIAPRYICVGSASLDNWADQYSEQLSCVGATPMWGVCGKKGYIGKEMPAAVGESFNEGDIHYHLRDGVHFLSRNDWNEYMAFFKKIM